MDRIRILLFINPRRIGGMATHSRKLGGHLRRIGCEVYYRKDFFSFFCGKRGVNNVVYVYATSNVKRLFLACLAKLFCFEVVVRIGGLNILNDNKTLLFFLSRITDHFIFVSPVISEYVSGIGCCSHEVLPGFIPEKKQKVAKLFDVSMTYMYTDDDIYNLSSIEMIASSGLILILGYYGRSIEDIPSDVRERLNRLGKMRNVIIEWHNSNFEDRALMSSIHVRLTRSDGDSNIIREMLYSNVPVICSNVVPRPLGTQVVSLDATLSKDYLLREISKGVVEKENYCIDSHLNFLKHIRQ